MTIGTICSGIGAPEIAFGAEGFEPLWFSEIDAFPSSVLAHRFPGIPNLGDFTTPEAHEYVTAHPPDVMIGGTPCQSFSVAGKRLSLADERGNLTLQFVRLWHGLRSVGTRYAVWENVEGVLGTADNAFGCFLAGLMGEEYPLRPAGERWTNAGPVSGPLGCVAWRTLNAEHWGAPQRRRRVFAVVGHPGDFSVAQILFEPEGLRGNFAESEKTGEEFAENAGMCAYESIGYRECNISGTIDARAKDGPRRNQQSMMVLGFTQNQAGDVLSGETMAAMGTNSNATGRNMPKICVADVAAPLTSGGDGKRGRGDFVDAAGSHLVTYWDGGQIADTQDCSALVKQQAMPDKRRFNAVVESAPKMAVRRLTPLECERLQGLPDGWTLVPHTDKPAKDGPRYKAIGNSMAVPCVQFIAQRIRQALRG